jgi:hypothetical protein
MKKMRRRGAGASYKAFRKMQHPNKPPKKKYQIVYLEKSWLGGEWLPYTGHLRTKKVAMESLKDLKKISPHASYKIVEVYD